MVSWITNIIEEIGYVGIGTLMLLETFVPFIQSEIVMPFSGFTASSGQELNIYIVLVVGVLGSELGALTLYIITRMFADETIINWVSRFGKWVGFSESTLRRWLSKFERHSKATIFIGRFIPGVRSFIAIPAGLKKIPLWEFALLNLAGTIFWVTLLGLLGFWLQGSYSLVSQYASYATLPLLALLGAYMLLSFVRRLQSK